MYFTGGITDSIYQFDLATPWDVTFSSSGTPTAFSIAADTPSPLGIRFKPDDGTKMYLLNDSVSGALQELNEYTLSTGWDVTTATFTRSFTGVGLNARFPKGVYFQDDGRTFYIIASYINRIFTYSIGEQ